MKAKLLKKVLLFLFISLNATIYSQKLAFTTTWEEAVKSAKKENKSILLVLTAASWCEPCIQMKKEVFADPNFISYVNANLILYKADLGKLPLLFNSANYQHFMELKNKHDASGLPSLVVVNSNEEKIKEIKGRLTSSESILSQLKKIK